MQHLSLLIQQRHLWEPMENEPTQLVQSAIESAAIATYHFIEDLNHKVPENKTSISKENK